MDGCLTENTLAQLLDGTGPAHDLDGARSHLESCPACRELFTEMTLLYESGEPLAHAVAGLLKPGDRVGRYEVAGAIGSGAMGTVYAARDPDLDRRIALKLVRRIGSASVAGEARPRLLREAQAMARLHHPNVVAVHDVGTFGAQVFLAMELVEGQTLTQWLAAERPWRRILDVFVQAGRGLEAAHAAGLVHRDFKPDNVLVDRQDHARVTDFGLARLHESGTRREPPRADTANVDVALAVTLEEPNARQSPLTELLTRTGALVGTPAYMAPEQLAGRAADPRSDQFSFCVALYEALCGTRPFVAQNSDGLRAAMAGEVLARPLTPSVPPWLLRVLERGLKHDPAARWPSMATLLDALMRLPAQRRRRRIVIVATLGALVVAAGGYRQVRLQRIGACATRAAAVERVWGEARRREVHAAFVATGRPFAEDVFVRVAPRLDEHARALGAMAVSACEATRLHGEPEATLQLRDDCLELRLAELRSLVGVFAAADAKVVQNAPQAVSSLSSLDECADVTALKHHLRAPAEPAARARFLKVAGGLAEVMGLREAGRHQAAQAAATALMPEVAAVNDRYQEARLHVELGSALAAKGEHGRGREELRRAILSAEAAANSAIETTAWRLLARIALNEGKHAEALDDLAHAEALNEHLGDDVERASTFLFRGNLLIDEGKADEAIVQHQRALALAERINRRDLAVRALTELAGDYVDHGELDKAQATFERSIALGEQQFGPHHPSVAMALANFGQLLNEVDRPVAARAVLERAVAIFTEAEGPESGELVMALSNLAIAYDPDDLPKALSLTERALAIGEKTFGHDSPGLAYPLIGMGDLLCKLKRPAEAVAPLERSLKLREATDAPPLHLAQSREVLGYALVESGRDRARGLRLVAQARAYYATAYPPKLKEVDSWLQSHR
jgi:tetratricopeptide (TPR) repeat protein